LKSIVAKKEAAPKTTTTARKLSGFMKFSKANRPALVAAHPDWKFGDFGKELGRQWKEFSDEEKAKWNASE
jgi:hypothetical protein